MIIDFDSKEHVSMIPCCLFNDFESKSVVLIDIHSVTTNKKVSKRLLKKSTFLMENKKSADVKCGLEVISILIWKKVKYLFNCHF